MKTIALAIAVAAGLAAGVAFAQSGADVVKSKCMGCHEADKKKGQEAAIVAKMKEGKGHPKVAASDAELKAAVDHVMTIK